MATTDNNYTTTNSSTTDFSFTFPYIKQADVKVSLDKVEQATTAYSFPNATTVRLGTAPATGTRVRVYRVTDDSDLTATFYPGSAIRSSDLNDNFTQNLYSTQEVVSRYLDAGGNLTVAEDAGLIFEGATDNNNETTLTVVDPTADRTITLPDITGTVITTGDTGTVTSTMINDGTINTADLNDNAVTTAKLADNAVTTVKITDSNVTTAKIGDGQVTTAKLADSNVTTAKIADSNIITAKIGDGQVTTAKIADNADTFAKIGCEQTTISDTDTSIPTSGAVIDYVVAQIAPLGGLEVISTEVLFPNTQPSAGVVISISDAGGVVFNGSGSSTTGRTADGTTVTINNAPSSLYSETLVAGVGLMVSSTGTGQVYNYHKILGKEDDIKQLSDDINDFNARYRVASSAPSSDNDSGDLYFNTSTPALHVYNGSAWIPGVSTTPNDGTVTTAKIANNAVDGDKLADNIDIAGTLDVTQAATFDAAATIIGGASIGGASIGHAADTGTQIYASQGIATVTTGATDSFTIQQTGVASPGVTLKANGAATFAGEVDFNKSSASSSTKLLQGNSDVGQNAGTLVEKFKITADGAATFIGDTTVGPFVAATAGSNGGQLKSDGNLLLNKNAGEAITIYNNSATKTCTIGADGDIYINASDGTNKAKILNDGNATFAGYIHPTGHVYTGNRYANGTGALLGSAGTVYLRCDDGSDYISCWTGGNDTGDRKVRITNAGNATFTGLCRVNSSSAYNLSNGDGYYQYGTDGSTLKAYMTNEGSGFFADKVGIGTTTPQEALHIHSTTVGGAAIELSENAGTAFQGLLQMRGKDMEIRGSSGQIEFYSGNADGASSSEKMRITDTGNIGVNINPGNFGNDNYRGIQVHSPSNCYLTLTNATTGSTASSDGFSLVASGSDIYYINRESTGSHYFSAGGSDRFAIKDDGKVGIGTTSPASQLQVSFSGRQGIGVGSTSGGGAYFWLDGASNGDGSGSDYSSLEHNSDGDLVFSVGSPSNTIAERMRITDDGKVGIGTASPDTTLHVNTAANEWIAKLSNAHGSTPYGLLINYSADNPNTGAYDYIYCNAAESGSTYTYFRVFSNGGIANYQSNDSNLCDEREKKNIVSLDTKWDKVKSWELKKFHYNEDADTADLRYGIIAQQVEAVCPEVITDWEKQRAEDAVLDEDDNVVTPAKEQILRKGVKEQQMMWMAIKALQEAMAKIETLEAKVAALEAA